MRTVRRVALVLFLVLVGGLAADAAEFGYVRLSGRDLKKLRTEQASLEKLVRSWPEGEVLYTKLTMSGLFVQRNSILMIIAGDKNALESFLDKSPYEGDVIKELKAKFLFNYRSTVKDKTGKTVIRGRSAAGMVRKYANPRDLLSLLKDASDPSIYEKLQDPKVANANAVEKKFEFKGALKLFANMIRPENFLCDWEGPGFKDEAKLLCPPGWESTKEYTEEESKEFIENLEL